MPVMTLPDGAQRAFDAPVSAADLAASISPSLAKRALAARVDGRLVDLSTQIRSDLSFGVVTQEDTDGLELLRHSTAHLLAAAVKSLFPQAQVTIGPVIEDGFYYDFAMEHSLTPEDLARIEDRMRELAALDEPIVRRSLHRQEAIAYFESLGEHYKAAIVRDLPADEVSLYRQGGFEDLCRGPHVPNTGKLKHFKLMKLAGAYWRGDHHNPMLQRIYGTAWASAADLAAYLHRLEEAEKRDHRRLGRELDLFHVDEHAPGTVFWHAKGWVVWQALEQYLRGIYRRNGYLEVKGPQILDRALWERTGHWDKYRENMFITESETRDYALKPMNCPGHILIYKQGVKSYRDLPLRLGEFGQCHRNEPSGGLHGIMRVRGFTQDDGHIFCTEDQIQSECRRFTTLLQSVYRDFGFERIEYRVATRPQHRLGSDAFWDQAEAALMTSLRESGTEFSVAAGEGAFYGPKIEYTLRDAIGRAWQCGTVQVDANMAAALGAEVVQSDGSRRPPIILHRAIVGSLERFIGILIEQHAGALPTWLAPVQVAVLSLTETWADYAQEVAQTLTDQGYRALADTRDAKVSYKIREHSHQKLPYILVVGERESTQKTVSVRARGRGELGSMAVADFLEKLATEISARGCA